MNTALASFGDTPPCEPTILPAHLSEYATIRALIIQGLTLRWGQYNASFNPDLEHFAKSYLQAVVLIAKIDGVIIGCGAGERGRRCRPNRPNDGTRRSSTHWRRSKNFECTACGGKNGGMQGGAAGDHVNLEICGGLLHRLRICARSGGKRGSAFLLGHRFAPACAALNQP